MLSQALRNARSYEEIQETTIAPEERPLFHLTPRCGWMNDPNGFCYYNGYYHLFYQYYPYSAVWGLMHWGHAVSRDLLHWEYLPAAMAPDKFYDRRGVYSGSAITRDDGTHVLMFTAVGDNTDPTRSDPEIQTQCMAFGDGIDYEKYSGNPVLTAEDLPEGCSRVHFRDPKMWREEDGTYLCAVSNMSEIEGGQVHLFRSDDLVHWKYWKVLDSNRDRFGTMWECPDFFPLDGRQVLLVSPQDMQPSGFEYHNGNGNLCLIGSYDRETGTFTEERDQAVDYGIDFYAAQTVLTPDGRRVMIGWMQNWDAIAIRAKTAKWAGQMSFPRELSIRDGRLCQAPLREIVSLYQDSVSYTDVPVGAAGEVSLEGVSGRCLDMTIRVRPADQDHIYHKFAMRFAQKGNLHTAVSFRPHEETVKVDRKYSGSCRAIVHQRRCLVKGSATGELTIRMVLDRFSAELFINDGIYVMTISLFTDLEAEGISFIADGEAVIDVEKHKLG